MMDRFDRRWFVGSLLVVILGISLFFIRQFTQKNAPYHLSIVTNRWVSNDADTVIERYRLNGEAVPANLASIQGKVYEAAMSPAKDRIAYFTDQGLFELNLVTKITTPLATVIEPAPEEDPIKGAQWSVDELTKSQVDGIGSIEYSPDGDYLIITAYGWEWQLTELYSFKDRTFQRLTDISGATAWSSDGSFIVQASNDRFSGSPSLQLWDITSPSQVRELSSRIESQLLLSILGEQRLKTLAETTGLFDYYDAIFTGQNRIAFSYSLLTYSAGIKEDEDFPSYGVAEVDLDGQNLQVLWQGNDQQHLVDIVEDESRIIALSEDTGCNWALSSISRSDSSEKPKVIKPLRESTIDAELHGNGSLQHLHGYIIRSCDLSGPLNDQYFMTVDARTGEVQTYRNTFIEELGITSPVALVTE